jgi:prophage antirepressor-like protein
MKGFLLMKKNQMQIFNSKEFGNIEVLMIDDKPYFPATESAVILGYKSPQSAVRAHCKEDGCVNRTVIDSLRRKQEKKYISEGNLYRLIVRSNLPAAERFETWVFDEVLPAIRKNGTYALEKALDEVLEEAEKIQKCAVQLLGELVEQKSKTEELTELTEELTELAEELAPKADYFDCVLEAENSIPVSIIAKDYGMTAAVFNELLHNMRIQYKIGGTWLLYQIYAKEGYTKTRTYFLNEKAVRVYTQWTQKGRLFLYETLKDRGILPLCERAI